MPASRDMGPDLAIVGSARSGTSYLASLLGNHPHVDAGSVKESNFFSREFHRGFDWYDGLYRERDEHVQRLDASMSYTFRQFPEALGRLVDSSPDALVIYAVRHPLVRLVSHFQLHRDYFGNESAMTLGEALTPGNVYAGASDYDFWLDELRRVVPAGRLLVVPFPVVTQHRDQLVPMLCRLSGLDPIAFDEVESSAADHQNQVVEFRSDLFRAGRRVVRRSGLYPWVRRTVGVDRLRKLRGALTRPVPRETLDDALATCSIDQRATLDDLYARARRSAAAILADQDRRLDLDWHSVWQRECPEVASDHGGRG